MLLPFALESLRTIFILPISNRREKPSQMLHWHTHQTIFPRPFHTLCLMISVSLWGSSPRTCERQLKQPPNLKNRGSRQSGPSSQRSPLALTLDSASDQTSGVRGEKPVQKNKGRAGLLGLALLLLGRASLCLLFFVLALLAARVCFQNLSLLVRDTFFQYHTHTHTHLTKYHHPRMADFIFWARGGFYAFFVIWFDHLS